VDFKEYLDEITDSSRRLKVAGLQRLSALRRDQADQLGRRWDATDVRRRRKLVQELADLQEDNVEVNFDAVFLLGLKDNDPDVRMTSVRGLWENESADLIGPLTALVAGDSDAAVRAEAALALGRFVVLSEHGRLRPRHFEKVESALRRVIEKADETEEVRTRALEAIGAHDAMGPAGGARGLRKWQSAAEGGGGARDGAELRIAMVAAAHEGARE
jgi:hypothetical protein